MAEEVARIRHDGSLGGRPARTASGGGGDAGDAAARSSPPLRHSSGSAGPVLFQGRSDGEGGPPISAGRGLSSRGRARRRDWHGWRVKGRDQDLYTVASDPNPGGTWALETQVPPHILDQQRSLPVPLRHQQQAAMPQFVVQGSSPAGGSGLSAGTQVPLADTPMLISGISGELLAAQLEQMTGPLPPLSVADLVAWRSQLEQHPGMADVLEALCPNLHSDLRSLDVKH